MRGDFATEVIQDTRFAALVLDLAAAGVAYELGEEKFSWLGEAERAVKAEARGEVAEHVAPVRVEAAPLAPRVAKPVVEVKAAAQASAGPVEGEVWQGGESGGLVIVMQADEAVGGAVAELLERMLRAVGVEKLPRGWVGVSGGKVEGAKIAAAVAGLAPQRTLVLGQGVLGMLVGRNLGVEGWHAAPVALDGVPGVLGVTYPPDLLLMQPLFKRLAWQHMLAWQQRGGE